jgi:signal transduction histidine kinase
VIYAWLALTIIALLLYTSSKGFASTKWAALLAFSGSVGFMATVINESIRPFFWERTPDNEWIDPLLLLIKDMGSFTTQIILPYAFLMFAIYSVDFISSAFKKRIAYGAFLPVIITFIVSPIYPDVIFNYLGITMWIGPYILTAASLLFINYIKESNPSIRLEKSFVFYTASIPMLFDLYTGFIARILGDQDAWRMNVYMIVVLFFAYIYLTIRYGLFGLKINFLKRRIDRSAQAVHDMAAMYNHTVKNELAKLTLYINKLQIDDTNQVELQRMQQSISHITQMSNRIQMHAKKIKIMKSEQDIATLIHDALFMLKPQLEEKQIQISTSYGCSTVISCDPMHMKEVFQNIFTNAIEAMHQGGTIFIRLIETKKNYILSIRDNGHGIKSEHKDQVFIPFFSTKNNDQNFGLGLGYCFNVMLEHKGSIQLVSDGETGTTVFLHFPKKK